MVLVFCILGSTSPAWTIWPDHFGPSRSWVQSGDSSSGPVTTVVYSMLHQGSFKPCSCHARSSHPSLRVIAVPYFKSAVPVEGCRGTLFTFVFLRRFAMSPLCIPCPWGWSLFIPLGHFFCPRGWSLELLPFMFPVPGESYRDCYALRLLLRRGSPCNFSLPQEPELLFSVVFNSIASLGPLSPSVRAICPLGDGYCEVWVLLFGFRHVLVYLLNV